jgi:hypothetical protein
MNGDVFTDCPMCDGEGSVVERCITYFDSGFLHIDLKVNCGKCDFEFSEHIQRNLLERGNG